MSSFVLLKGVDIQLFVVLFQFLPMQHAHVRPLHENETWSMVHINLIWWKTIPDQNPRTQYFSDGNLHLKGTVVSNSFGKMDK